MITHAIVRKTKGGRDVPKSEKTQLLHDPNITQYPNLLGC